MFLSILAGFYFCKQKTAYEMRISDWSSDVCSSDLSRHPLGIRLRPDFYLTVPHGPCACFGATLEIESNRSRRHVADGPDGDPVGGDRKRVVAGKSVSVGVDLGGRRIIKKKRTQYNIQRKKLSMTEEVRNIIK